MRKAISTTLSMVFMLQISYAQPFYSGFTAFPALNSFSENEDCWGVYNLTTANEDVLDDIFDRRDRMGVVPTAYQKNNFFAIQDLKNSSNPTGQAGFLISFDISSAGALECLSIDMGAMGNWDKQDHFKWIYSIDEGPVQTAFEIKNDPDISFTYTLVGGNVRLLNHPLEFTAPASLKGKNIGNKFRTYTFRFPPDTQGEKLYLYLIAESDGSNEIYCFDNISIKAAHGSVLLEDGPEQDFIIRTVVVPDRIAIDEAKKRREEQEEEMTKRDYSFFYHYY